MIDGLRQAGLGRGIYSVIDATRLTQVSSGRVRRWMQGYRFGRNEAKHTSPPVFRGDYRPIDGCLQLSFMDLMEIRVVARLLDEGISWTEVRKAGKVLSDILKTPHPYASLRFLTDGRKIFFEHKSEFNKHGLVEAVSRQQVFERIVKPHLRGVDFTGDTPVRWWPLDRSKSIVVDPQRSFGRPIVASTGIPTEILASHAKTIGVDRTAQWFDVSAKEVRAAVGFEARIAA